MSEDKLVSVVVPAYNASRTIVAALDSVFDQESSAIECIVVDDGSRDCTGDVVARYIDERPAPDIRLVIQENAGVSAARNRGIDEAGGTWVVFLDADDVLAERWFDAVTAAVSKEPHADVIVFSDTCPEGPLDPLDCLTGCVSSESRPGSIARSALCCPVAKAYARSPLRERALRFPKGVRTGEDMLFNAALYAAEPRVYGWPRSIYTYRKTMGSVTNSVDQAYLQNELDYHEKLMTILEKSSLSPGRIADIARENCLGGILGVVSRSQGPDADVKKLLLHAAYQDALDSLPRLEGRFSSWQVRALRCVAAGDVRRSARILALVRFAKRLRYALSGGVLNERI